MKIAPFVILFALSSLVAAIEWRVDPAAAPPGPLTLVVNNTWLLTPSIPELRFNNTAPASIDARDNRVLEEADLETESQKWRARIQGGETWKNKRVKQAEHCIHEHSAVLPASTLRITSDIIFLPMRFEVSQRNRT